MKRLFWLAVGVGVGAVAVRKLSRKAEQLTPRGMADQVTRRAAGMTGRLSDRVREFTQTVREGFAERENELHEAMLPEDDGYHRPGPRGGHDDYASYVGYYTAVNGSNGSNGSRSVDPDAPTRWARDPDAAWPGRDTSDPDPDPDQYRH